MSKLGIFLLIIGIALLGYGGYQFLTYRTITCNASASFIEMKTNFKFTKKPDKLVSMGYKMKMDVPDILDPDKYEQELSDSCDAYENCKVFRMGNTITISYEINDPSLINDTIEIDGTETEITYDNLLKHFEDEGLDCK